MEEHPGSLEGDPRKWWALAVLLLAQLMIILDIAIVNVALPSAQADLDIAQTDVQWIVTSYLLPFGGLLLLGGRVADFLGRKRVFCVATIGFAAASALGGAANEAAVLFAARALQGLFAAAMAPSLLSMLTLGFPTGTDRARAFSLYGGVGAAGGALGLVLGGLLTEYLSWRWSLLINVPVSLVVVAGALPLLRESRAEGTPRLDLTGAALGTLALLGVIYGIATAAENGWEAATTLVPLICGVVLFAAFVAWENRAKEPLMPLSLLRNRLRGGAFLTFFVVYGPPTGWILLLLIYLQGPRGMSPLEAGVTFLPTPVAALAGALLSMRLLERVPPRVMIGVGSLVATAGIASFVRIHTGSAFAADILPGMVLVGLGTSVAYVAANSLAFEGVADRDTGLAGAVINTVQQIGAALGVAILTTVAAGATEDHLAAHGPRAMNDAIVRGNDEAFVLGAILMLACGVIATLLIGTRARPLDDAQRDDGTQLVSAVW